MDRIDFRSDTVSWPTPTMRQAMAQAPLGDDVYGEDPTVNELEALAAARMGKEAGLFVASGTMGNLVAILSHATRGDEVILGQDAHTYRSEAGGMATLGGIVPRTLPTDKYGRMDLHAVETAVRPDDPHFARSRLILVENSYARKNGYPIAPDYFADIQAIARKHHLYVHLDGARLFNAAIALDIGVQEITKYVDSVSFCLSKGLCAPVGSVVCGSAAFIHQARRARKVLGGGMRQAGVLAAAGIISLTEMIERLADDHAHARQLAEGLAAIPGIDVELDMIRTNMVFFTLANDVPLTVQEVTSQLRQKANIWVGVSAPRGFRAVTHYWIGQEEVALFLETMRVILGKARREQ
jgi:threonine aldolase